MLTRSSQKVTLERLMAVPGIGARVMSSLPIPNRIRLRRTCRAFKSAVDDSLHSLTELFGEDIAGGGCHPGERGLTWLLDKCPHLVTLSTSARADHLEWWNERDATALAWTWLGNDENIFSAFLSLDDIGRRYRELEYLNVAGCVDVTDADLTALARSCRHLLAVDVSGCRDVTDASIIAIAEHCKDLQRIFLCECEDVTDYSLVALSEHCRHLVAVGVGSTSATDVGITALVRNCPQLRQLVLPDQVTDAGIRQVAQHCPELMRLGLTDPESVTEASMKIVAERCRRLEQLDGPWCDYITDDFLCSMAGNVGLFRRLSLARTPTSDRSLGSISDYCWWLQHLDVRRCVGVTDEGLEEIAGGCKQLRHLAVSGCPDVGDFGVRCIAERCPNLRTLKVADTEITDDSMRAVAAFCPELRQLDMSSCFRVVDAGTLVALARGCRELEHLDVSWTECVTQGGVAAVSRYCVRLRVFRACCGALRDKDVAVLIKGVGRRLRVLDLAGNKITDRTLKLVGQHCRWLHELDVASHSRVTDAGVSAVALACRELRMVDVSMCKVTDASLSLLDRYRCDYLPRRAESLDESDGEEGG
eukprot:jgi/Mesvir1/10137/Mv06766-RA.1